VPTQGSGVDDGNLHGEHANTAAFAGEVAHQLDERQYEQGYGPAWTRYWLPDRNSKTGSCAILPLR